MDKKNGKKDQPLDDPGAEKASPQPALGSTIQAVVADYLVYLRATRSLNTSRTYAVGLRHFQRYLESQNLPPDRTPASVLGRTQALGFITWLYNVLLEGAGGQPEKISERTKNTYFAAVAGFYEFLVVQAGLSALESHEYDTLRKALTRAARPQAAAQLPPDKLPSQEIIQALLEVLYTPPDLASSPDRERRYLAWLRDIALVEALLSSGMRVGEIVRLERGHLLYPVQGALVKYAKGKKEREVLFSPRAWDSIQTYLAERKDGAGHRQLASLPVFARHDRRAGKKMLPLSTRSVQQTFFQLADRSQIVERFHLTPHTLRHFFATEFLSQTGDLALTQYALGHTSPLTTRIYAQTRREDYQTAHRQVFQGASRKAPPPLPRAEEDER